MSEEKKPLLLTTTEDVLDWARWSDWHYDGVPEDPQLAITAARIAENERLRQKFEEFEEQFKGAWENRDGAWAQDKEDLCQDLRVAIENK